MTVQTIINIVQTKKRHAELEEDRYNLPEGNYYWELGERVYSIIYEYSVERWMKYGSPFENSDGRFELFGYPLKINHNDKDAIKLWREVG